LLIVLGPDRAEKHQLLDLMLQEKNAAAKDDHHRAHAVVHRQRIRPIAAPRRRPRRAVGYAALLRSQDPDIVVIDDLSHAALLHRMQTAAQGPCFVFGNLRFSSALAGLEFLVETTESGHCCATGCAFDDVECLPLLCPECSRSTIARRRPAAYSGCRARKPTRRRCAKPRAVRHAIRPAIGALPGGRSAADHPGVVRPVKSGDPFLKIRPQLEALHGRSTAAKTKR
jgi:hypothetical protein